MIGLVGYDLALPAFIKVHNVFHVYLLKNYILDANHVIDWNVIKVESKGDFPVQPVSILGKNVKLLRNQ